MRRIPELEPDAIREAHGSIPAAFRDSPQFVSEALSAVAGRPVIVKIESANPIGAFKGRGAWLAIAGLVGEGRIGPERPVVTASTGNFGQATAYAGRAHGVPVVVFADDHANPRKLDRIRRLGARVVQGGDDFDVARVDAESYAEEKGYELLVDGSDPRVAAGAGTLALEVTDAATRDELPLPASAYVPVGNGALIIGVGAWLRHAAPGCRVVGVQSDAAASMTLSWRAGKPIETESAATFADGIATRVPVPEAIELMDGRVDDMLLVSEDALRTAQTELTQALGITAEGGAAASWAGLLADAAGEGPALVIITGSNVPSLG